MTKRLPVVTVFDQLLQIDTNRYYAERLSLRRILSILVSNSQRNYAKSI